MYKRSVFLITAVLSVFLMIGCGGQANTPSNSATDTGKPQKLVVALKPDKNPDQMMAERESVSKFLSEKLGRPVEVIIPLSSAVINEGFSNGTIDIGYLSGTDLINAKDAAELLLVGEINGKTTYKSYWVSLKDKPYSKIEDLKGKPVAFAGKTSTSGFVIPLWDLRTKGLVSEKADPEEFFGKGNVFFGTGYVSAIERVLSGEAEAAAVSYYVLDETKHLSDEQRGKLKKVAEQGDVPTHIIAIRKTLTGPDRDSIKAAILSLNEDSNIELRDKLFTSKLVEADQETHLKPLRDALAVLPK